MGALPAKPEQENRGRDACSTCRSAIAPANGIASRTAADLAPDMGQPHRNRFQPFAPFPEEGAVDGQQLAQRRCAVNFASGDFDRDCDGAADQLRMSAGDRPSTLAVLRMSSASSACSS